jgi:hypothetical protein
MTTPKGTRCKQISLEETDAIHVYSNSDGIILQVRRDVPTETDMLSPSFKIAVRLQPNEALALAGELLSVAVKQVECPAPLKRKPK